MTRNVSWHRPYIALSVARVQGRKKTYPGSEYGHPGSLLFDHDRVLVALTQGEAL
jgi:hypothetical protein